MTDVGYKEHLSPESSQDACIDMYTHINTHQFVDCTAYLTVLSVPGTYGGGKRCAQGSGGET
jgi:hypothetical protein